MLASKVFSYRPLSSRLKEGILKLKWLGKNDSEVITAAIVIVCLVGIVVISLSSVFNQ